MIKPIIKIPNGEIEIEHGIPMPTPKGSQLSRALDNMAVGDSIVISLKQRSTAVTTAAYRKMKLAIRKIDSERARAWRVK